MPDCIFLLVFLVFTLVAFLILGYFHVTDQKELMGTRAKLQKIYEEQEAQSSLPNIEQ